MATKLVDLRNEIKALKEENTRLKVEIASAQGKPVKTTGEQLAEAMMKRLDLLG